MTNGKHYGHRSHSEADLLASAHNEAIGYDYTDHAARIYGTTATTKRNMHHAEHSNGHHQSYGMTMHRKQSNIGLVYPNIQVHCLDVNPCLRGVSLQAKAGDLFAIMATSQREGTALTECLAGLRERMAGEVLINGQQINRRGLKELCSYVPSLPTSSLDPRMSVQCTLNFHAALRGPLDRSDLKDRVNCTIKKKPAFAFALIIFIF